MNLTRFFGCRSVAGAIEMISAVIAYKYAAIVVCVLLAPVFYTHRVAVSALYAAIGFAFWIVENVLV